MGADRKAGQGRLLQSLRALRYVNFRWYWTSGLGMTAAQGLKELALAWLVLDLTGSLAQLGIVAFAQGFPMPVVGLFGGVLADRYDRRWLLFYSQIVTVLNLFALAVLTVTGRVEVWHVYVSSVLLGTAQAFTNPARQALIRSLVAREETMNAVALNNVQMHVSRIVWPSVAGGLISLVGIGWTMVVSAGAASVGVGALLFIRGLPPIPAIRRGSPVRELGDGLRYVWATPVLASVVALAIVVGSLGVSFMRMAPGFAREELSMNAAQTGLLLMFLGMGSVTASVLFLLFDITQKNRLYFAIGIGIGVALLTFALNPWYAGSFIIIIFLGMGPSSHALVANTIFQMTAPPEYLGRVVSFWGAAAGGVSMSVLVLGIVGDAYGLRVALAGSAILLLVITAVLTIAWPPVRKLLEAEREPQPVPSKAEGV